MSRRLVAENSLGFRAGDGMEWFETGGDGWRVAFSTRAGGVSPPPFDSLNIGFSVNDDPGCVRENRARLTEALGLCVDDLVVPGQVHGTTVALIGSGERGRGATAPETVIAETDGLLTTAPGIALFVSFADCVPVFLAAERADGTPAIALVHAGWRGMADGIIGEAARSLRRNGAALRAAVIGPSICRRCFTVGAEVGERFLALFPGSYREGRVDLWEVAKVQLGAAGLAGDNVLVSGLCTSCDERFYSHRRDGGLTGRQAALAWIPQPATAEPRSAR